jgi:hypothetical protein
MPLDHIGYYVPSAQLETEVAFLIAAFKHMDINERMRPIPTVVGLGTEHDPFLWVAATEAGSGPDTVNLHYAVKATSKLYRCLPF